jgi:regulatory protein
LGIRVVVTPDTAPCILAMQQKYLTKEQALQKLRQYCGYQERSHYEVKQKLWDLGVRRAEHDEIISTLIEENYLNEERFAVQFAGGKFRMKNWGRKKIYYALKEKKVSDYSIRKAMKEINEEDYLKTLNSLAEKKYESLKGEQYLVRRKKTMDYLLQKGYEPELITAAVNRFVKEL